MADNNSSRTQEVALIDKIIVTNEMIEDTKARANEYARDMALRILEGKGDALDQARMMSRHLEEAAATVRELQFRRNAYEAALLIAKVASGEYIFAAHTGYYGDLEVAAFRTEEERQAFLEDHSSWRRANEGDLGWAARGCAIIYNPPANE